MPERPAARWVLLACVLLLWHGPANAERWYRVELLVFAQPGGAGAEQWAPIPRLEYPGAARFLLRTAAIENNNARYGMAGEVDEFGRQLFELPDPTALPPLPQEPLANPDTGTAAPATGLDAAAPGALETGAPPLPTPFLVLPRSLLEFRGKAAYMERRGGYRMLFHETWLQPVGEASRELPIVLDRSGDSGTWPELQGSVRLYLSRYLHLETNLWLNTRGEYLPGEWRMPPAPLGPPSVIVTEPPPPLADTESTAPDVPAGAGSESVEDVVAEDGAGPVYPWRHAVLQQQKRRMRSNEVHYIDHPMLGVIAKLTPLTEEDLWDFAAAETGPAVAVQP